MEHDMLLRPGLNQSQTLVNDNTSTAKRLEDLEEHLKQQEQKWAADIAALQKALHLQNNGADVTVYCPSHSDVTDTANDLPNGNRDEGKIKIAGKIKEQLELSGLHGISSIFHAGRTPAAILWLVLLLLFFAFALLHTYVTVQNALESPTHYNFRNEKTRSIPLPDFTICSGYGILLNVSLLENNYEERLTNSTLNITEAQGTLLDLEEVMGLLSVLPDLGLLRTNLLRGSRYKAADLDQSRGLNRVMKKFDGDTVRAAELVARDYILPCNAIFSLCGYSNMQVELDCCKLFRPIFNMLYGPCYTTQMADALPSGLNALNVYHNVWVNISKFADPFAQPRTHFEALNVLFLYLGKEQYGTKYYTFLPYSYNEIFFDVRHVQDLHDPTKCATADQTVLPLFEEYSPERCFVQKMITTQLGQFGCIWPLFALMSPTNYANQSIPRCGKHQLSSIRINCIDSWGSCQFGEAVSIDRNECLPACDRMESSIGTRFTTRWHLNTSRSSNDISLMLSYSNEIYTSMVEQETLTWTDYLSMVGGLWGLWLGSSIITFLHIIVACISLVYSK